MRDARLVMPKAVSAAMVCPWITARRICVQVVYSDSWLDSFMEISVFCQFKMRMEQKEVTELADGHGGVKEESVSPVFHNQHHAISVERNKPVSYFRLPSSRRRLECGRCQRRQRAMPAAEYCRVQVYRRFSGLQCLHSSARCLARGNQLEFGILAQVAETDACRAHSRSPR